MTRKLSFALILAVTVLAAGSTARAQMGTLTGHVYLKKDDGTKVPVEGALVDIYRTDIAGHQQLKTRKDGSYVHAGLMFVGTYTLAVSAPGATPKSVGGVKAGTNADVDIELSPGDGRVLTETEAKATAGAVNGTEVKETAEEKAKREAFEAKNAEITAANKKAESSNATVIASFNEGNKLVDAARKLKNDSQFGPAIAKYGEAIAKFDEGIKADPDHPGIPSLLTNKAMALTDRGLSQHNLSIPMPEGPEKTAAIEARKADLTAAVEASSKAVSMLEAAGGDDASKPNGASIKMSAISARAIAYKYYIPMVDSSKADDAVAAWEELIVLTLDPTKKIPLRMEMAKMLFDAGESAKAAVQYQKVLTDSPDNLEATYWLGLSLVNQGSVDNDKAKIQEGINYLQAFADKAPATDPRKVDVAGIVEEMKKSQNVTPQKPPTTRRRGN